jgi:hypothetical protein
MEDVKESRAHHLQHDIQVTAQVEYDCVTNLSNIVVSTRC